MSAENPTTVEIASGDALDVRHFRVAQRMSELFTVTVDRKSVV